MNHFDICLKHTAGKEIKFTDFINRNPTKNPEPEEKYEEEIVINAIAQLATVNARIGRIFDQSEDATTATEANLRDTRSLIDTRRYQTNKNHIDSNYRIQQIQQHSSNTDCSKMNNNENTTRFFRTDGQLRHHWGADDDIMAIINARDKSPENTELVRGRTQLARPGVMRLHFNKNLGREISIPRRPEEDERREIKRIDIQVRQKIREQHISGGYFQNFGDDIPQGQNTERNEPAPGNETNRDADSTVSNNSEEAVATHEPGTYPAIPIQEYRDGPIEEIAVHYVRINRVVEEKPKRNRQQEDNVRSAELDFMLDLETIIKETAADPDLIELNCCIEDNKLDQIPQNYRTVAKKLTHRWGIILVDDRIVIPKSLRYAALNALHFGHPGINKMYNDAAIFWWPNMREDIEKKSKTCSVCLNAVDSKDLSVYITRNSTGQITDHLVMSKKKIAEPRYKRGMTFSQTKKTDQCANNNNTGKEAQHPPKHCRPTHLLQNTEQRNHQWSTLHLQQERDTEKHGKL